MSKGLRIGDVRRMEVHSWGVDWENGNESRKYWQSWAAESQKARPQTSKLHGMKFRTIRGGIAA